MNNDIKTLHVSPILARNTAHKTTTLNVITNKLVAFTVYRQVASLDESLTVSLAQIGVGLVLGCFIWMFEKRGRRPEPERLEWTQ